ncbi:MAG: type II toxin-antitoxin system YafQ family toxin [Oscillospiraceae bacterium]
MLKVRYQARFKKDYKLMLRRGFRAELLEKLIGLLVTGKPLPPHYRDHALSGTYGSHRECHITPDWLLIYKVESEILTLTCTRTGTHADLFGL